MRRAGILLPMTSIPSLYGVGDFGKEAYEFIDLISEMGFSIWQVLPLNPLGQGNSPYQPISSRAIDEIYISPYLLKQEGLIKDDTYPYTNSSSVNYEEARSFKYKILEEVIDNFECDDDYLAFSNKQWVKNYAQYRSLEKKYGTSWQQWPDSIGDQKEIEKQIIIQYLLNKQWHSVKEYANKKGIDIFGDIPFYVGLDSVEVYQRKECFLLNENGYPEFVAGVPGDGFNPEGQKWGNPLYNWDVLEEEGYSFWVERIKLSSELYDMVRIDHFRAFDSYWKIPANNQTALEGEWNYPNGYEVVQAILDNNQDVELIAEDLGYLRNETYQLRDYFQLKGMRVIQYLLDHYDYSSDPVNSVAYSGTHDCMTLKQWYESLYDDVRNSINDELHKRFQEENILKCLKDYVLFSNADISILSMVDILELDGDARINYPGTSGPPNWQWRLLNFDSFKEEKGWLTNAIQASNRKR